MLRSSGKAVKPKDKIKLWNIAVGDTVKVISGPSRGTIGKVEECLKDRNRLVVSGVNVIRKVLPLFLAQKSGIEGQRFEYPGTIHYSNVQLVGDIPSSADFNGPKRRVEIKRINTGKTFFNRDKRMLTWRRWVPGENVFLPWPKQEKNVIEGSSDTKQKDVAAATYIETLRQSPIPLEMQHELRNKYSKFRRDEFSRTNDVSVEDVEGIEQVEEFSDDADLAQSKPRATIKKQNTAAGGLTPETINILAQAMSKKRKTEPTNQV